MNRTDMRPYPIGIGSKMQILLLLSVMSGTMWLALNITVYPIRTSSVLGDAKSFLAPNLTLVGSQIHSRILIYITTHLSSTHKQYLERCWPHLLSEITLYQIADFMIFMTLPKNQTVDMTLIYSVFAGAHITVHVAENPGYQEGAILAMTEAFKRQWFDPYDWVIRLNPDVMIRNDSFLLEQIGNDGVDGIFADCWDVPCPEQKRCEGRKIHTDFFAFRPNSLPITSFARAWDDEAEMSATKSFSSIIAKGRDRWVPGAGPHNPECRIRGESSPVIHTHDFNTVYPACLSWYT